MKNIEKYKTAVERSAAFRKFCTFRECKNCKLGNSRCTTHCSFTWLELEAEEEKPLPCPFCGCKPLMNCWHLIESVELHWVDCVNPECMYRSAHYKNKQEAIAAHNRFAKAVMDAKNKVK